MKILLLASSLLFVFARSEVNAASQQTWICLKNSTNERKLILVEDIDNYDWDGVSRPDRNWHGTYIDAGKTRCERAEINIYLTSVYFSFIIPGRDSPHKLRMVGGNDCDDVCPHTWKVRLTKPVYNEGILIGTGKEGYHSLYQYGIRKQYECTNLIDCSYFTIQDVP
jgi:hypothetical protein